MIYLIHVPYNDYSYVRYAQKFGRCDIDMVFVLIYGYEDDSISVTNVHLYYIPWFKFTQYSSHTNTDFQRRIPHANVSYSL